MLEHFSNVCSSIFFPYISNPCLRLILFRTGSLSAVNMACGAGKSWRLSAEMLVARGFSSRALRMKSMQTVKEACPCSTQAGLGVCYSNAFQRVSGDVWHKLLNAQFHWSFSLMTGTNWILERMTQSQNSAAYPHRFGGAQSLTELGSDWPLLAPGLLPRRSGVELSPEVLFEVLRRYCILDILAKGVSTTEEPPRVLTNKIKQIHWWHHACPVDFGPQLDSGLLESVLCAAGANPASGLHPKHAYSILDVRKAVECWL